VSHKNKRKRIPSYRKWYIETLPVSRCFFRLTKKGYASIINDDIVEVAKAIPHKDIATD
jgi:hypothetical protein